MMKTLRSGVLSRLNGIEDLAEVFGAIFSGSDVEQTKPAPDIYLLAAKELGLRAEECLVLEDSPNGVRAGVAAGMNVIAIATPFTTAGLHSSQVLDHAWIVHDSDALLDVVRRRIEEHNRSVH